MWANAQRDGRPAEYRWRPLFNAAKFGWRPLLECRTVTLPRRETRWNLQGCPKLANRSQPLVGRSSPYYQDMWRSIAAIQHLSWLWNWQTSNWCSWVQSRQQTPSATDWTLIACRTRFATKFLFVFAAGAFQCNLTFVSVNTKVWRHHWTSILVIVWAEDSCVRQIASFSSSGCILAQAYHK